MRPGRAVIALSLLAACGRLDFAALPDAPQLPPNQSGTRLKLRWNVFDDGTRQIAGVYDSLLGVPCTIEPYMGGTSCVPNQGFAMIFNWFSDAACTQPIGIDVSDYCEGSPEYALDENAIDACGIAPRVRLTSPMSLTTVYVMSSGSCTPQTSGQPETYYGLAGTVVPSDLAAISTTTGTSSARLAAQFESSDDGFRVQGGIFDASLGTTCYVSSAQNACVPAANAAIYSDDSTCSSLDVAQPPGCAAPYAYVEKACSTDPGTYYSIGPPAAVQPSYQFGGDQCVAGAPPASDSVFALANPVELTPVRRERDTAGATRLRQIYDDGDGVHVPEQALQTGAWLYDSLLGIECEATTADDGVRRCIPNGLETVTFYSDAACTNAVEVVDTSVLAGCSAPPPPVYALEVAGTCGQHVFAVGGAHSGQLYTGSTCTPFTPSPGELAYDVTPLPASMFAAATLVTDP